MMTLRDELILLGMGLIAIYLIWHFMLAYRQTQSRFFLYYALAFFTLLIAGVLLLVFTYAVLGNPLVVIVATVIPTGIALGLVAQFFPRYENIVLPIVTVALGALALTRFTGPDGLATLALVITHATSGVLILGIPIWLVARNKAPGSFLLVAAGGLLIDVGGVALAFLKSGRQLLFFSETLVFAVLAPLLFLMSLAFAWGFVRHSQSRPIG